MTPDQHTEKISFDVAVKKFKTDIETLEKRMVEKKGFLAIKLAKERVLADDVSLKNARMDLLRAFKGAYEQVEPSLKALDRLRDYMKVALAYYKKCRPLWNDAQSDNSVALSAPANQDQDSQEQLRIFASAVDFQRKLIEKIESEVISTEDLLPVQIEVHQDRIKSARITIMDTLAVMKQGLLPDQIKQAADKLVNQALQIIDSVQKNVAAFKCRAEEAAHHEQDLKEHAKRLFQEGGMECPPVNYESDDNESLIFSVKTVGQDRIRPQREQDEKRPSSNTGGGPPLRQHQRDKDSALVAKVTKVVKDKNDEKSPITLSEFLSLVDDSQVDWDEIVRGKNEAKFVDRSLEPARKIDVEDLPIFDGNDLSKWPTFRAALDSCIILKKSLDWPQKLHYLLRGLRGYPRDLIDDYPRTRMGFAQALHTLRDEYDSFQKHKSVLIESVKNLKPMDKRDLDSIRAPNLLLRRIVMWAAKSGVPSPASWGESLLPLVPMDYATKENWRNFQERKNVDSPNLDHFQQWTRRLMNRLHENTMRKNLETPVTFEEKKPSSQSQGRRQY